MKSSNRGTGAALAVLAAWLAAWLAAEAVGGGEEAKPAQQAPVPGAELRMPPLPPLPYEREVADAVFRTFPNADAQQIMAFMREQDPLGLYEFKKALMQGRGQAAAVFTSLVRESMEMMETRDRDPERFGKMRRQRELEQKAVQEAEAGRASAGAERDRSVTQLRRTLEEAFQIKQDLMKSEVAALEADLKKLEQLVRERETNREAIISRRVEEMTGKADATRW
jgi:hypothetical protein